MRLMRSLLSIAALCVLPYAAQAQSTVTPDALQATRSVAAELLKTLSGQLQHSMQTEGAARSIAFCKTVGPKIALDLADKTGWDVTRIGTRVRDVDLGTPRGWQKQALTQLETELKSGANPQTLEWHEVVTEDGKPVLHYAKAIVLQTQCLACHGTSNELAPGVAEQLNAEYPHDQATGYAAGDLRGAVAISRPLPGTTPVLSK